MERHSKWKIFSIGFLGNVLEWYDFSIYAYLAVVIGQLFFSSENPHLALISAFFLFSVSYLIRPVGSLLFGYIADRYSRSKSLRLSLVLMAIPTVLIGILPTYYHAGVWATASLIILRLIQGFAAGGELPVSACYVYEASPDKKRFFYCSFVASSSMLGVFLGSLTASALYLFFSHQAIMDWAWRIPFLMGFIVAVIIFFIRRSLVEEPHQKELEPKPLLSHIIKANAWPILQIVMLNAFISVAFYLLFVWMPSYLHVFLGLSAQHSLISSTAGLLALILLTLIFGYFARKIGRRNLALFSIISIMLLVYPLFLLINTKVFAIIILVQLIFAVCLSAIDGVNMEMMASLFNKAFRCRGISIGFTLATAIFGGTAPVICSYLIYKTGATLSPVFFLVGACLIALPAAIKLKQH